MPATSSVDDLLKRRSDLAARLAENGMSREALACLTYTRWEAWLAIGFHMDLLIVEPAASLAARNSRQPTPRATSQAHHLDRMKAIDRYPGPAFTSADNLVVQVFGSAVIYALVRAAASSTHQPRNPPVASLGDLFKGRDAAVEKLRAARASAEGDAVAGRASWARRGWQDAARDRIRLGARGRLFGAAVRPRQRHGST